MSDISKYMKQLASNCVDSGLLSPSDAADFAEIGLSVYNKVDEFCATKDVARKSSKGPASVSTEGLDFDGFMQAAPVDSLKHLVENCGVAECNVKACCEKIINVLNRTVGKTSVEAWAEQNKAGAEVESGIARADLGDFHSTSAIAGLNNSASLEAFGANTDLLVPDLKINISVAIMSFHARILPRILSQRPINEPLVQYKKETLEAYDLTDPFGKRVRQIEMYSDPKFVTTKLQEIVPLTDNEKTIGEFLLADGIIKFGVKANILQLSKIAGQYGHDALNRTDLISDRVLLKSVRVELVASNKTETFDIAVPYECRLSRQINSADSGDRAGDFKFKTVISKGAKTAAGAVSEIAALLGDGEDIVLSFSVKPFLNIKFGYCDALGSVSAAVVGLETPSFSFTSATAKGYSLDARYDEANLRKSNIAIWTNTQPLAWDIPAGRNFVYDYALGQKNSEKVPANMMGTMGIAQDKDAMGQIVDILNTVYDDLKKAETIADDNAPYVGSKFVAGDKVKPTIYMGTLDFSDLNIVRDGDRSGDIKQKFMTYVTGVTGKILNESFFLQQLGGKSQVVFKCWCSIEILSNVIGQQLYNPGIKDDVRGSLGDGVEYSIVLPNNVRLDFVTTTFADQQDKIVGIVAVESAESELNFGHNWDYGVLVSHYTVSGSAAHNRLFGNMRYLIVPTNPLGFIIDINGVDVVTDMALETVLRPRITATISGGNIDKIDKVGEITAVVKTKEQTA